ncbi:MAG: hypothetical protein MRY63_02525 [Neomegalonema sp.]|nr:hypothetical protein [Neomegalonema sp.]
MRGERGIVELSTFEQVLSLLDGGDFLNRLKSEQRGILDAVRHHREEYGGEPKGSLTLKVQYVMSRDGTLGIKGEISAKQPAAPGARGVAWLSEGGRITTAHPGQMAMELREAAPPSDQSGARAYTVDADGVVHDIPQQRDVK